ncbi:MAG: hypothetical protein J6C37_00760, partial [Roseburia sp.]|nr:hypothetical protein [Roseburia sp.]
MHTQTYFHTRLEYEANRKNDRVPLQVNCVGAVVADPFSSKSIRRDFYYIYVLKGKMVMPDQTLYPGDVMVFEPEHAYRYQNEGETTYFWVHYTGFEAYSMTKSALGQLNVKQHIGIHRELIDSFKKL